MRFLRGWTLINLATKHVNIKGLQMQFSALKKMPLHWPRGTGLPLWGRYQPTAVALQGRGLSWLCDLQAQSLDICAGLLQRTLDNPDTVSFSCRRLLCKENKQTSKRELQSYQGFPILSQTAPRSQLSIPAAVYRPAQTAPERILFFVKWSWDLHFPEISLH